MKSTCYGMIAISADDVQLFDRICHRIMELDQKIRFVGVISQMGKVVAGGERKGTSLLIKKADQELVFMAVALRVRMRHELDMVLGPVNYTVSHREKLVVISFPFKDKILYVSAEKNLDLCETPQMILKLIQGSENI